MILTRKERIKAEENDKMKYVKSITCTIYEFPYLVIFGRVSPIQ